MPAAIGKMMSGIFAKGKGMAGKVTNSGVGSWLTTPSTSRRVAAMSGLGIAGYATSDAEDFTGRMGRAVGFMVGGGWAARRMDAAGGSLTSAMKKASGGITGQYTQSTEGREVERYFVSGIKRYRATGVLANRNARKAGTGKYIWTDKQEVGWFAGRGKMMQDAGDELMKFSGVEKFGIQHGIGLGAMYGLVSDEASVMEGATGCAFMYGGARMMGSAAKVGNWSSPFSAYKNAGKGEGIKSFARAAANLPLVRAGAGFGMASSAYSATTQGESMSSIATGATVGGITGGAVGGLGKLGMSHPMMTLMGAGLTATAAGSAAEAYGTFEAAGRPGFDDMDADGDLALALHRTRRAF